MTGAKTKEFNGYSFDNDKMRSRMRYLVVLKGDLDLNGVYAFKSKKDLAAFMQEDYNRERVQAVFMTKAIDV